MEDRIRVRGVYLDAYNAIVRPHRIFPVRLYTLRRWLSLLKPTGFWILVSLQQECYRSRGNQCVVSRARLAQETGVGESTVHRYLRGGKGSPMAWWVRVRSTRKRQGQKVVQAPNQYWVIMDAPLSPVDQRGLAQFLYEQTGGEVGRIKSLLEWLSRLPLGDLLDLGDEMADRFSGLPFWERDFYFQVEEIVRDMVPDIFEQERYQEERKYLLEKCRDVQRAYTGSVLLSTQYFRQKWVPILGPKLAAVVLVLRSYCYRGEQDIRTRVAMNFTRLAEMCGCSARWLQDVNRTNPISGEFFRVSNPGRGGVPEFEVSLVDPLVPSDWEVYNRGGYGGQNGTDERLRTERMDGGDGTDERHGSTIDPIIPIITVSSSGVLKTRLVAAEARRRLLLDEFGIGSPAVEEILRSGVSEETIRAWMLYAITQKNLRDPCAFVVRRLRAGDRDIPPGNFLTWARLGEEDWRSYWRMWMGYEEARDPEKVAEWGKDFGSVFPMGPFGDAGREVLLGDSGGADVWESALDILRLQTTEATFGALFAGTDLEWEGDIALIRVRSRHAAAWLSSRQWGGRIREALGRVLGREVEVRIVLEE